MAKVTLEIPDELFSIISEAVITREIKKHLAVAFYAQKKISLGSAAELAEMSYYDFWQYVARFGLGPCYTKEQLEEDVKTLKELKVGKGIKAEYVWPKKEVIKMLDERYELRVWDDLEDEEVDKIYEELYYLW